MSVRKDIVNSIASKTYTYEADERGIVHEERSPSEFGRKLSRVLGAVFMGFTWLLIGLIAYSVIAHPETAPLFPK